MSLQAQFLHRERHAPQSAGHRENLNRSRSQSHRLAEEGRPQSAVVLRRRRHHTIVSERLCPLCEQLATLLFFFSGHSVWNSLPQSLRLIDDHEQFRKQLLLNTSVRGGGAYVRGAYVRSPFGTACLNLLD